ncbi:MAG: hypothetical protein ACFB4I_24015, partial [Cyanophyceae cyanobacterium]
SIAKHCLALPDIFISSTNIDFSLNSISLCKLTHGASSRNRIHPTAKARWLSTSQLGKVGERC